MRFNVMPRSVVMAGLAAALALAFVLPAAADWHGSYQGGRSTYGGGWRGGGHWNGWYGNYGYPGAIAGGALLGLGLGAWMSGLYAPPPAYWPRPVYAYPPAPYYVYPYAPPPVYYYGR